MRQSMPPGLPGLPPLQLEDDEKEQKMKNKQTTTPLGSTGFNIGWTIERASPSSSTGSRRTTTPSWAEETHNFFGFQQTSRQRQQSLADELRLDTEMSHQIDADLSSSSPWPSVLSAPSSFSSASSLLPSTPDEPLGFAHQSVASTSSDSFSSSGDFSFLTSTTQSMLPPLLPVQARAVTPQQKQPQGLAWRATRLPPLQHPEEKKKKPKPQQPRPQPLQQQAREEGEEEEYQQQRMRERHTPPRASSSSRDTTPTETAVSSSSDVRLRPKSALYRTELCVNFVRRGVCIYQDQCFFAHSHDEIQQRPRLDCFRALPCPMLASGSGKCSFNRRCNFAHLGDPIRKPWRDSKPYYDSEYEQELTKLYGPNIQYPLGIYL